MPCFLVGLNSAKILAAALKFRCLSFLIRRSYFGGSFFRKKDELFNRDFIAFHVSGGTTEAVFAKGYGSGFRLRCVQNHLICTQDRLSTVSV